MASVEPTPRYLVGLDENGLGARLGPMLVTGVLAEVNESGEKWLRRKLPPTVARDLDDSKNLVSFKDCSLGEGWARALLPQASTPAELLESLIDGGEASLRRPCPKQSEAQCWSCADDGFSADTSVVERLGRHLERMRHRGVKIVSVRSEALCVRRLNDERQGGGNRFVSDLHAMERLILGFRRQAPGPLSVCCGKVGGISNYERYFGPLSGRLRVTLEQSRRQSAYRFPDIGEVRFVQDADADDPIVMLASMVGKYLRELLMGRISRFYSARDERIPRASGYHDPVTQTLVRLSAPHRRKARISPSCFERAGDA